MADLTKNREVVTKQIDNLQGGIVLNFDVAASEIIYKGALVQMDAGFDIVSAGAAGLVTGLALEKVDNSSGSDGDLNCAVLVGGIIVHALTSTQTDIGKAVYASDDQTLTFTAASNALVGWMLQITDDANIAIIQMIPHAAQASAMTAAEPTLTNAGSGGDSLIQAMLEAGAFGFKTAAEGEQVVETVLNNQARIAEIVSALTARGIIAS